MRSLTVFVTAFALMSAPAKGQVETPRASADSVSLSVSDTVRVWSHKLNLKSKRGVVSRVADDSLAFMAPAGFRQVPREFVGDLASIDRIDVLEGRHRSAGRAGAKMLLGGAIGAVGGALIGTGIGTILYEMNKSADYNNESGWDNRGAMQFFGAAIFGTAGAAAGALGGLVDGARAHEKWRRVR
jgi:hypothetical protein